MVVIFGSCQASLLPFSAMVLPTPPAWSVRGRQARQARQEPWWCDRTRWVQIVSFRSLRSTIVSFAPPRSHLTPLGTVRLCRLQSFGSFTRKQSVAQFRDARWYSQGFFRVLMLPRVSINQRILAISLLAWRYSSRIRHNRVDAALVARHPPSRCLDTGNRKAPRPLSCSLRSLV